MIKIKLYEAEIHRNETTFRPFVMASRLFEDVGIKFIAESDSYDFAFVGQASIINKKISLYDSVQKGLEFVSKITGDYFIIDGQDSTSLIGTIDVFRESSALLFFKNSYLKDMELYKIPWANGRYYWGEGNYSTSDIDNLKPRMRLTGCNWLHTIIPQWIDYKNREKSYDVSCMFGYPTKETVYEHGLSQTHFYDKHRENLFKALGTKYKVAKLENGRRIPIEQYYNKMYDSKIIIAPLGYGEMAPRDIESAIFGSVLVKPDMSYISSEPFIYKDNKTYIAVKYDWSNLEEKIDYILSDYENIRENLVYNMRKEYTEQYNLTKFVLHFYNELKTLDGIGIS